jgi:hypothetical protein
VDRQHRRLLRQLPCARHRHGRLPLHRPPLEPLPQGPLPPELLLPVPLEQLPLERHRRRRPAKEFG